MTLEELALRETDPKYAHEFKPIALGVFMNFLLLAFIVFIYSPYILYRMIAGKFTKKVIP